MIHRCPHCGHNVHLNDITDRQLVVMILVLLAVAVVAFCASILVLSMH